MELQQQQCISVQTIARQTRLRGKPVDKATKPSLTLEPTSVFTVSYHIRLATSTMAVVISEERFDKFFHSS